MTILHQFLSFLQKIIEKPLAIIHEGLDLSAKSFGFHSWDTMVSYIFLITNKFTTGIILATSFAISISGWFEKFIFSPTYTFIVFMCLMLSEIIFGTMKAIIVDKEKFNWDKFARIIPKFLAHTFALSAAYHMSIAEPLFSWMPSTVFIFFSIQNFMKSLLHLIAMKTLDGDFANFMKEKFSQNNDFIPTKYEEKEEEKQS